MEQRKVSFREVGLDKISPGVESWGPRRVVNSEWVKKCDEVLQGECEQHPGYQVHMTVDHPTKNLVFRYIRIDHAFEAKMRKIDHDIWRSNIKQAQRTWKELEKKGGNQ